MIRRQITGAGPVTMAPVTTGRAAGRRLRHVAWLLTVATGLLGTMAESAADTATADTATGPASLPSVDAPGNRGWTEPTGAADIADPVRGKRLWGKCRACHTLTDDARHSVGPTLYGLFGRRAGAAEGYNYSAAMRDSGLVWTDRTLDAYLAATQDVIPGSKMYGGLAIARDRRDLLAWLRTVAGTARGD